MRVSVLLPTRLVRTPDGCVWSQHPPTYSFFARYLNVFSSVNAVSRIKNVKRLEGDWHRVDGKYVTVSKIPNFVGPFQYAQVMFKTFGVLRSAITIDDAVVMRDYGAIGGPTAFRFHISGRPYGIEVIGDPYDVFAPGSVNHFIRPLMRILAPKLLKYVCKKACAATYVTKHTLQRKYPTGVFAFNTYFSSVQLPKSAFAVEPRKAESFTGVKRLIFVGSMAQKYKGGHVLIKALADRMRDRTDWHLRFVGDGVYRADLERQSEVLGIADRVTFLGRLTGPGQVRKEYANSDLFIHPALTEGMPRALIEAMAQALPCIGSDVGGIPEILEGDSLVPPGDSTALGERIVNVLSSPEFMSRLSVRNLAKSQEFVEDVLIQRRDKFYHHIKDKTESWNKNRLGNSGFRSFQRN